MSAGGGIRPRRAPLPLVEVETAMRRRYPERLAPSSLSLSREYMGRESLRWGRDVEGWVRAYATRNKIPFVETLDRGVSEARLRLDFPSRWRQKFFVLRGNSEFPYFEFL